MASAKVRLPLDGTTTLRPNTSCTSTAAGSASMSASATRITEFSCADSVSCGAPSAFAPFLSLAAGGPSGNAVLNFPVNRSASGQDFPLGRKSLVAASPEAVAAESSTSIELGELSTRSVTLMPATGLTLKAPPKTYSSVCNWLVTTSWWLKASLLSERTVGV